MKGIKYVLIKLNEPSEQAIKNLNDALCILIAKEIKNRQEDYKGEKLNG